MHTYQTICICGGGSLGHTIAASISSQGYRVNLLTGHPGQWSDTLKVTDCRGEILSATLHTISDKPADVIPQADLILLCVPGYLIQQTLEKIAPYLAPETEIGSVVCCTGFFWMARHVLGPHPRLFGFQRVPFISRVKTYGKEAELKGYKSQLKIGGNRHSDLNRLAAFFSDALRTPTIPLGHYLEASLTNSNPILHPARIYGMLSPLEQTLYEREFMFYEEWDDYSSDLLIRCDGEFQNILAHFPIRREEIPPLLAYYESSDASSLTRKIRSIGAFQGIKMKMQKVGNAFAVDYADRYFTEDIPYGLLIVKSLGVLVKEETPVIDEIIRWMQQRMGKEYLTPGGLTGKDIPSSGIVQNYQLDTKEKLYNLN